MQAPEDEHGKFKLYPFRQVMSAVDLYGPDVDCRNVLHVDTFVRSDFGLEQVRGAVRSELLEIQRTLSADARRTAGHAAHLGDNLRGGVVSFGEQRSRSRQRARDGGVFQQPVDLAHRRKPVGEKSRRRTGA